MTLKLDPVPTGLPITKPNLVIFMPDQLRYDALGCNGNAVVKTPNIDAFAARGTRFTNCFVQASVCSQSRCSMFTGQYPHVAGHRSIENLIKPWEPNVFRSLKENGYHVACLAPRGDTWAPTVTELSVTEYGFLETPDLMPHFSGAWGGKSVPEDRDGIWERLFYRGRREKNDAYDYDETAVRSAEKWLSCPPKEPWVLFVPLIFPHCPFSVEEPYFSMYNRGDMTAPSQLSEKQTGYEPRYMKTIRERYGTSRATPEMWAEVMATYYGMITRLDDQFGRIISLLDSKDLFSKTATLFFTDHGEYLGDHGLIEKWPSGLSDSLTHEPLIIAGAGLPEGKVNDQMAEMVDFVPTVLQLAGIGEHWGHNGTSLLPTILHGTKHKDYAFSEGGFLTSEEPLLEQAPWPYDIKAGLQHEDTTLVGKAISIRDHEWTYIYRLYESTELYSRIDDPSELHNLAADPRYMHVVRMMEAVVLRWMVETSDVMHWTKDPRRAKVELESPWSQLERRKKEAGEDSQRVNHKETADDGLEEQGEDSQARLRRSRPMQKVSHEEETGGVEAGQDS
ncbi:putative sulfatase [Saccharata proteae CBS 121410]|uniref:Sulfatase n=1 Tax=Saccharata proteae CBS 121410 TaxID=1314787 RepID=A0A9P4HYS0_9PEZI|nr:putative sulfatase [Saccharata proteae CBS 121410]